MLQEDEGFRRAPERIFINFECDLDEEQPQECARHPGQDLGNRILMKTMISSVFNPSGQENAYKTNGSLVVHYIECENAYKTNVVFYVVSF